MNGYCDGQDKGNGAVNGGKKKPSKPFKRGKK
jgi:hypothetical protein